MIVLIRSTADCKLTTVSQYLRISLCLLCEQDYFPLDISLLMNKIKEKKNPQIVNNSVDLELARVSLLAQLVPVVRDRL